MARIRRTLAAVALAGSVAVTACSAPPTPAPAAAPTAAAPTPAPAAARDSAAACSALTAFDAVTVDYPGADPDSPPPSAEELKYWAGSAQEPIGALAANVPVDLDPDVGTLRTVVQRAEQGSSVDTADPGLAAASTAVDKWGHDNCGFASLDVTANGSELTGVPATLAPGPLAVSFANSPAAAQPGFVLLLAKVDDGATYTLDAIRNNSIDLDDVAEVVAAAQPTPATPTAFTTLQLEPGRYLVVSPLGAPPDFAGSLATEVEAR